MSVSYSFGFQELLCKPKLNTSIPCLRNILTNSNAVHSWWCLPDGFGLQAILVLRGLPAVNQKNNDLPPPPVNDHLTEYRNQPGVLRLRNKGIPQFDSLAKKPRAFLKISRSMRSRLFSAL